MDDKEQKVSWIFIHCGWGARSTGGRGWCNREGKEVFGGGRLRTVVAVEVGWIG